MNYRILDTIFALTNQNLLINNEKTNLNNATLKTLQLFLESNGKVISKDELMDHVWADVIVSDSSIFKQIELLRKLFSKAGLPQDTIESIYAKGYKVKYEITPTTKESTTIKIPVKANQYSKKKQTVTIFVVALITLSILFFLGFFNNKVSANYLSSSKRESIVALMNNDWNEGLRNITETLERDKNRLSRDDMAFLYNKKGNTQYHLQEYMKSLKTYDLALDLYEELNNTKQKGDIHLNISKSLGMTPKTDESYQSQLEHINKALKYFRLSDSQIKIIDTQMELADLYQKNDNIPKAISIFEKTIIDANNIKDTTGAMIANNNLAAAHLILNNYDKAIELGQNGLDMALKIGKGRYIANSYSFLSDLYQNQYRSIEAMEMIQHAIKHQLANNDFKNLAPKLMTLDYLLVQTFQHEKAEELLNLSHNYAQSLKMNNGVSIISLYKGLNAGRQNNWLEAEEQLKEALKISQRINFKYKQPLNKAYLSLAYYFNKNNLQAIEKATEVINNTESDQQSKAIAALSLAYSYTFLEKIELANKWFQEVQLLQNPKWLFEYRLFLKLKLERQNNSILSVQTKKEIQEVEKQMLELTQSAQVGETLYKDLITQISEKMNKK